MDRGKLGYVFVFLTVILLGGCSSESQQDRESTTARGSVWKQQAIDDVITPWTQNGYNPQTTTFPAYMDRQWEPYQGNSQFPGMVARHVFSYSTAYLLTGDDQYLSVADRIVDYMIENGWDSEHGLWFNELDAEGNPVDFKKDMFMQLYAVTGLAMYYVVTKDERVWGYINKSIDLLNEYAWDDEHEGYINILARDLSVDDATKKATPQLAPISGYLAYLYPATRDQQYLDEQIRGIELILEKMMAPEQEWLLESFTQDWQLHEEQSNRVNVGHNLEVVWLLLRLHLLTGDDTYREQALELYTPLYEIAFNTQTGAWHHSFLRDTNEKRESTTWWIQAYGNMLELYMYRITGAQQHLDNFDKGARFWNDYFMDKEYGASFLRVHIDGELEDGSKAVRSKTAYHSMEHGLLNYLYTNLWVDRQPVTLHYRISSSTEGDTLYPNITEDPDIEIQQVLIEGKSWEKYNNDEGSILLPVLKNGKVEVRLLSTQN
ncbi:MAG: AGE family epimerase/isomerase [Balneolaceae bacterium]|nr:AGE family epimerase/isomerase [Balneolaceae bacterium]